MITLQGKGVFGGIAIGEIAFFKRDSCARQWAATLLVVPARFFYSEKK